MHNQNNNKIDFFIKGQNMEINISLRLDLRIIPCSYQQFSSQAQEIKAPNANEAQHIIALPEGIQNSKHLRNISMDRGNQEHED